MLQNNNLIKTLAGYFWNRLYHIRMLEGRDVQPDNDARGLWARLVNRAGLLSYTDHFRSGVIPTGFSWIADGTFNGAPAAPAPVYSQEGTFLWVRADNTPHFLADAITVYADKSFYARMRLSRITEIGIRIDDGSDNNYTEMMLDPDGLGAYNVDFRYRAGGGAVTDVPGPLYPATEFVIARLYWYTTTPEIYGYTVSEDGASNVMAGFNTGALAWVPARVGIKVQVNTGGYGSVDWFYSTFS